MNRPFERIRNIENDVTRDGGQKVTDFVKRIFKEGDRITRIQKEIVHFNTALSKVEEKLNTRGYLPQELKEPLRQAVENLTGGFGDSRGKARLDWGIDKTAQATNVRELGLDSLKAINARLASINEDVSTYHYTSKALNKDAEFRNYMIRYASYLGRTDVTPQDLQQAKNNFTNFCADKMMKWVNKKRAVEKFDKEKTMGAWAKELLTPFHNRQERVNNHIGNFNGNIENIRTKLKDKNLPTEVKCAILKAAYPQVERFLDTCTQDGGPLKGWGQGSQGREQRETRERVLKEASDLLKVVNKDTSRWLKILKVKETFNEQTQQGNERDQQLRQLLPSDLQLQYKSVAVFNQEAQKKLTTAINDYSNAFDLTRPPEETKNSRKQFYKTYEWFRSIATKMERKEQELLEDQKQADIAARTGKLFYTYR